MEVFIIILLLSLLPLGVGTWIFLKVAEKNKDKIGEISLFKNSGNNSKSNRMGEDENQLLKGFINKYTGDEVENRPGNIQVIRDIGGERIGVSKNSRMRENILIPEGLNEGEKQLLRDFYDI